MINEKKCSKCGDVKNLNEFYKQKGGYLGKRADCKVCCAIKQKLYSLNNKEHLIEYYKEYNIKNKKKIIKRAKEYYKKNKEHYHEYGHKYYINNREDINQYTRDYYKKHTIKSNEYGKVWRKNNIEKCREYTRNRNKRSLELATIKWMRNALYRTEQQRFKKTKMNTVMEFGYTPKQLIERIECQFKEGMSWNNRNEWHIDHKKPISSFKSGTNPRIINMLCNLQPLWATDNLSKNNKF